MNNSFKLKIKPLEKLHINNSGSIPVMNMIKSDMFEIPTIFIPSKDYDDISEMIIEALNQLKE